MTKLFPYPCYGTTYHVTLQLNTYQSNKSIYLALFDPEEGPITTISINMPYNPFFDDPSMICLNLDNDTEDTIKWLKDNGLLFKETNMKIPSGYCLYPVVMLDLAALKEAAPYDFEKHIRPYHPNIDEIMEKQAKEKEKENRKSNCQK